MRNRRNTSSSKLGGFTLTELMIVVTITGILAALAIPQLSRYRLRARAWQAEEFLQAIGLRQEAFRAEFGRYISTNDCALPMAAGPTCFTPDSSTLLGDDAAFVPNAQWQQLGAAPAGSVYYGFGVSVGTPAAATPDMNRNMEQDFWWVAQASGDIDNDGTFATFELTSQSRRVWISNPKGYD